MRALGGGTRPAYDRSGDHSSVVTTVSMADWPTSQVMATSLGGGDGAQ